MLEGFEERVMMILIFIEIEISDPVLWSFAQMKKIPFSIRCDSFFSRDTISS